MDNLSDKLNEIADGKTYPEYINTNQILDLLQELDYPLLEKEIKFRRDEIAINGKTVGPELNMGKVSGYGNSYVVSREDFISYMDSVLELSIQVDYSDVRRVVEAYDLVLQRSRKYGMRGQRNFTGKIEDEIRGKLVEVGFEKYAKINSSIDFLIDFELIDPKESKRDKGDFIQVQTEKGEVLNLPDELTFSVKSTNGFFLAVPKVELGWEGNIFVLAKLHIKEDFLYKVIKKGLELGDLNYTETLGWFEIRGFVDKKSFSNKEESYFASNFPGRYSLERKFRQPNFIRTPSMLNRNKKDLLKIFEKIKYFTNKN